MTRSSRQSLTPPSDRVNVPTRKFAHDFLETNKVQVWVNQQLEGR